MPSPRNILISGGEEVIVDILSVNVSCLFFPIVCLIVVVMVIVAVVVVVVAVVY